jgi:hypothetical protein
VDEAKIWSTINLCAADDDESAASVCNVIVRPFGERHDTRRMLSVEDVAASGQGCNLLIMSMSLKQS